MTIKQEQFNIEKPEDSQENGDGSRSAPAEKGKILRETMDFIRWSH